MGRIDYEDDMIIVKKGAEVIYKGIYDYCNMNDADWQYDENTGIYRFDYKGVSYTMEKIG